MIYTQVKNLPKDCDMVAGYPFPFKFSRSKLYVYEPYVSPFGENVWCRRSHDINSSLAFELSKLTSHINFTPYYLHERGEL